MAKIIRSRVGLDCSNHTVQRKLKKCGFVYKSITKKIRRARVAFANREQERDWGRVVFTDEKRFTLNGPDNMKSFQDQNLPFPRQNRGGGIKTEQ